MTHEFILRRESEMFPTKMMLVNATTDLTISTDEEVADAIKDAVTSWARQSEEGRDAFDRAGTDLNVGDLAGENISEIVAHSPNIYSLELNHIPVASDWLYDTSLCNDITEDAYESDS